MNQKKKQKNSTVQTSSSNNSTQSTNTNTNNNTLHPNKKTNSFDKFKVYLKVFRIERILLQLILFTLLILLLTQINFVFKPFIIFLNTVIVPLVLSGVLYYLTSPVRDFLIRKLKIRKTLSVLTVFSMILLFLFIFVIGIVPTIKEQIIEFTDNLPTIIDNTQNYLLELEKEDKISMITDNISMAELFEKTHEWINVFLIEQSKHVFSYIGAISTYIIYLIIVPILLYYLLKEDEKILPNIMKFISKDHKQTVEKLLIEMNSQLKDYVIGQITVYIVVGILNLIGFYILGLNYALLLAILFLIINCVPVIGVFFAATPAVIVALLQSPILALKIIILVTIVNQLDTHVLSPQIMGKKLNIHPITIIILMLVAGNFLGVLGLIFALPVYVLCKVLVTNIWQLVQYKKQNNPTI